MLTQHPNMKKRQTQTVKIAMDTNNVQTECASVIDIAIQSESLISCSTATMTDKCTGDDKSSATEPPKSRHIQTWAVHTLDKNIGPSTRCTDSQVDSVHQIEAESQTPYEDQTDQTYVQSMDDYLFQKYQELHELQSEFVYVLEARSHKIQKLAEDIEFLKNIPDDNSIT